MIKKQLDALPEASGVYLFKDISGKIVYVGKAVNLKARAKSYFVKNPLSGIKSLMISEIAKIDHQATDTEIDALILESQLIKKHRPKYNVTLKDDKNYFYVAFTDDEFPKLFITHQPSKEKSEKRKVKSGQKNIVLGPYTDGQALKSTLKYLRKIFPYCTCKSDHKNKCLKTHIGLCVGICCAKDKSKFSSDDKKTYKKNINSLVAILSGRKTSILKSMGKEMRIATRNEDFEKAAKIRDQANGLSNVFEHRVFRNFEPLRRDAINVVKIKSGLSELFGKEIQRVEFYDVSNIQGELATASMVVFDGQAINKKEYRKFKIKTVLGADDPRMMEEVLMRRFKHSVLSSEEKWPMPDLVIVDGGITQLGAAMKVLSVYGLKDVRVASLAKKEERLFLSPINTVLLSGLPSDLGLFIRNLRDEAHRLAIGYHKKLRHKKLKEEFLSLKNKTADF